MLMSEREVRTGEYVVQTNKQKFARDCAVYSCKDRTSSVNKLFIICKNINRTCLQKLNMTLRQINKLIIKNNEKG